MEKDEKSLFHQLRSGDGHVDGNKKKEIGMGFSVILLMMILIGINFRVGLDDAFGK